MTNIDSFLKDLPDADSAARFFAQFSGKHPSHTVKLVKNRGLLSDVLTLASFSPLLAATLLQNPEYAAWLDRKRSESKARSKDELLESLARLALTNSQIGPQVLFARFRRRELLRIFLRDIRRLATIAEITDEISNLADAILENALRIAKQDLDNRYGSPLEIDDKGRSKPAEFSVVSLGKLGSKELNYASDIDLLFLYSADGITSGSGSRDAVTNREYFAKLAESITKLVGHQTGEGAAYRVDLRLRPHGRVGSLAISLHDAVRYYKTEAAGWERQVLIRSRSSAGSESLFRRFFNAVEDAVFSLNQSADDALRSVRLSKEMIDFEHKSDKSYNVKLGRGGIREIEFIAQALQLAHGGKDRWLRSPHTLISLSRLADRRFLNDAELTLLSEAYEFFRRLEHLLQMEHGLQTHSVPREKEKRLLAAKRSGFKNSAAFEKAIESHAANVHRVFARVFGDIDGFVASESEADSIVSGTPPGQQRYIPTRQRYDLPAQFLSAFEKADIKIDLSQDKIGLIRRLADVSPKFTGMIAANPRHVVDLSLEAEYSKRDFQGILRQALDHEIDFGRRLSALRKVWSRLYLEIAVFDILGKLSIRMSKQIQTELAEASIETALFITIHELSRRLSVRLNELPIAVLALGKLGGGGIDYDSDLDLLLVYDDDRRLPVDDLTHNEFYSRAVEIFVTTLSSMTRDGNLYRVDLRLRPHGRNGATAISTAAFMDYVRVSAAVWELLAYVKLRGVGGDIRLAESTENAIRGLIHDLAAKKSEDELRRETRSLRMRLEQEKSRGGKGNDIDIKFGPGGLLDVYFIGRFLQLRDNLPDESKNRSTAYTLQKLFDNDSLSPEDYKGLSDGYEFLSALDHALRISIGRSTRLPLGNRSAMKNIAERMHLSSAKDLREQLMLYRLDIRSAFESILGE